MRSFEGEAQLATRLEQLFLQAQCDAECALVQERVEGAACEMRAFVVDGAVAHFLYTRFDPPKGEQPRGAAAAARGGADEADALLDEYDRRRAGGGGDDGGDGGGDGGGYGDDGDGDDDDGGGGDGGGADDLPSGRFSEFSNEPDRARVVAEWCDGDDAASGTKLRPEFSLSSLS